MNEKIRIHVSSQPSEDYPHNKANQFTAKLPQTLQLRGQWKIALDQIIFSSGLVFYLINHRIPDDLVSI